MVLQQRKQKRKQKDNPPVGIRIRNKELVSKIDK